MMSQILAAPCRIFSLRGNLGSYRSPTQATRLFLFYKTHPLEDAEANAYRALRSREAAVVGR